MGTLMKNGIPYGGGSGGESVEIVDNLESTDTDKALSANMGRELKEIIDNADISTITRTLSLTLTFTNGSASIDLTQYILDGYKLGQSCFAQLASSGSYMINACEISSGNTMTVKCYRFADGTGCNSSLPAKIMFILQKI